MAGGKETPRQKMIGMMYLVLTALLALQVSSNILDKFASINTSLVITAEAKTKQNTKQLGNITKVVKDDGRKQAMAILDQANNVRKLTSDIITFMDNLKKDLVEKTGGIDENGKMPGAKDEMVSLNILFGPGDSKSGEAYKLQKDLNTYAEKMSKFHPKVKFGPMAVDGIDEGGQKATWVFLNFNAAPMIASLAILSKIENDVLAMEAELLLTLAGLVGADDIAFDQVRAEVIPESSILAAGTKYKAKLFIAASSSNITPTMKYGSNELKVEDGVGIVEFTASGGAYDQYGKVKKKWQGSISIPKPGGGDTIYTVDQEYTVVKPVIQIQSASVSALYLNCGNQLNVQVPALGDIYSPSFSVTGGNAIPGEKKGEVTIVPNAAKVALTVSSNGNNIGTEEFKVRGIPLPTIAVLCGNKPCNEKSGEKTCPRSITVKAIPDESFKNFLPMDARYKVSDYDVTLARGRRPVVAPTSFSSDVANLSRHASQARTGDRLLIEIKGVTRRNFRNENEKVRMGAVIYKNIPIN